MDITEVSLSAVTAEFISYIKQVETIEELDQASEFLVVAATLLDLKIARLLPQGELVDAEDVALLEARDLLFARLLQYRAFKEAAIWFNGRIETETSRHMRVCASRSGTARRPRSWSGPRPPRISLRSPPSPWRPASCRRSDSTICTHR